MLYAEKWEQENFAPTSNFDFLDIDSEHDNRATKYGFHDIQHGTQTTFSL